MATGVLVGMIVAAKVARWQGQDPEKIWNLGILLVLSAIVGAKLLLFINDWGFYWSHPGEIFSLSTWQAGGVFYGGVLAALITGIWYIRSNHLPTLRTLDSFAPGLALGHAIGRVGCFAAGCCYGKPTSMPWGVTFTNPLANAISGTPLNIPIQPTQLFESAVELINFGILFWLVRHKKFEGQVIGSYLFLYGVARYFLEFIRDDPDRGNVFGIMTGTQLISICLVIVGGVIWLWRKKLPEPAAAAPSKRVKSTVPA